MDQSNFLERELRERRRALKGVRAQIPLDSRAPGPVTLKENAKMKFTKICILLVICLCLGGIAYGQETTGVIEGTVVDA